MTSAQLQGLARDLLGPVMVHTFANSAVMAFELVIAGVYWNRFPDERRVRGLVRLPF